MPYADYAFYKATYGGSAVPAERWGGVALRADAIVDEFTFGRLRGGGLEPAGAIGTPGEAIPTEVRMACCAVADVLYAQLEQAATRTPGVASEDIEGLRVTYASSEAQAAHARIERCEALEAFLPRWHPLRYAGV